MAQGLSLSRFEVHCLDLRVSPLPKSLLEKVLRDFNFRVLPNPGSEMILSLEVVTNEPRKLNIVRLLGCRSLNFN